MISSTPLAGRRAMVTGGGSGIGRCGRPPAGDGGRRRRRDGLRRDCRGRREASPSWPQAARPSVGSPTSAANRPSRLRPPSWPPRWEDLTRWSPAPDGLSGRHAQHPLEAWEAMLRVNLTGVFLTVKHTLPHLLEAGGGSIVTIGSVASLVGGRPRAVPTTLRRAACCSSRGRSPSNTSNTGSGQLRVSGQGAHGARGEQSNRDRPGRRVRSDSLGRRPG